MICRHCRQEWRAVEVDPALLTRRSGPLGVRSADSSNAAIPDDLPPVAGSSSVAIDTRWAGRRLGRYKVLSILGQGGMGVVWRGHDDQLRRDVALKILHQSRRTRLGGGGLNLELFMQEARAVAKLQHPGVVAIYEVAEDQDQVFLALELMEGGTLKERIEQKGPIKPAGLFHLMIAPAKALALAHRRGIIHRDIKPGNLMFDDHGHLKLMDFGLADVADEQASERIRGRPVGSLGWIAPETARGHGTTARSDLYSFGLVMLYALTGKPLIHADSRSKFIALHQNPPEPNLRAILGLTLAGAEVLRRCLAVNPAERFGSADELADAIKACADENPIEEARQRKSKASLAVAAAALGLAAGVSGMLYWFTRLSALESEYSQPSIGVTIDAPLEDGASAFRPALPDSGRPEEKKSPSSAQSKVPWPDVPGLVDLTTVRLVASRSGSVFHTPGSDCGRSVFASNLLTYTSVQEALADGRKPCLKCRPLGQAPTVAAVGHDEP